MADNDEDQVRVHHDGPVATVTLCKPAVHNAFDDWMIAELTRELLELHDEPSVRVVVLAADGTNFSAGADLNWMKRMAKYSYEENYEDAMALGALLRTINTLNKPIIAKVQGAAFGGGVGLVAACDMAVASNNASFSLSEVKLGIIPAVISPYVVNAIGQRQARRYMMTAERFSAQEAHRIGLVHEVVDYEDLDATVDKLVNALLANGPHALFECKQLIAAVANRPITEAVIEDTAERISRIRASEEGQEGLGAFLEKRKPAWIKG